MVGGERAEKAKEALSKWSLRQLIALCLGAIIVVFFASTAAAILAGGAVSRAMDQLHHHALPHQGHVAQLGRAYVDQQTAHRGFMITGNPDALNTYVAGKAAAGRLVAELEESLAHDDEASRHLAAVVAAVHDWVTGAAEPQLAARRVGPVPPEHLAEMTLSGMLLFDEVRVKLSALQARVDDLVTERIDRVRAAQRLATNAHGAVALLLLAAVILAGWLLRNMLTRPVALTLRDVTAVAEGDYDRTISSAGLREVAALGAATETMRRSLRTLVTEKERANSSRAEAEVRYRILVDNAVDVIMHLRGREVVWISRSAETAFGWPPEQWIGSDFSARVHPDDLDAAASLPRQVAERGSGYARFRAATADGGYRWVESHAKPYIDAQNITDGIICSTRIVDGQVETEQRLEADRGRFKAVAANAPSAISVTDLDHRYTVVNDAFCQLFGQGSVEDVIGRSNDEILPPDVLERSRHAVDRLLAGERLVEEEPIDLGHGTVWMMTQRFGLRDSTGAISEFVAIRTDITHRKKIEQEAAERAMWEERIRAAVGDGRLLVYSQPIVDIATGEAVEEELLVRLRAPATEQVLTPDEFLPHCQRHDLMPVIDRYMVDAAINLARVGRYVCVNISGQTIGDHPAMREIIQTLAAAGPGIAERILFEITETTALTSLEIAKTFSQQMRSLGCRVALDDFGTGYGAFTELRNLDLHTLKIDLSFVQNMLEDPADERVVSTIVFIARQYNLTTVAEGVETQALLDKLAELGVDRAQGYLFGKPSPVLN